MIRSFKRLAKAYVYPALTRKEIKRLASGTKTIIVGPWLSEVGFELLYWIPFLTWVVKEYGLDPNRLVSISRGGVSPWYEHIAGTYIDIFDFFSAEEFKSKNSRRVEDSGGQKHMGLSAFDGEIIALAKERLGDKEFALLHPSVMYNLFHLYWQGLRSIRMIENFSRFESMPATGYSKIIDGLPKEYIAVKFYFSACFPKNKRNEDLIDDLLKKLTKHNHVVLLSTGLSLDDHSDFDAQSSDRLVNVAGLMNAQDNLEIQTQIVSKAQAFIGTYGGFSYLAPFYGVPSMSFFSQKNFLQVHLDVARRAFDDEGKGSFTVLNAKDIALFNNVFSGEEVHDFAR